MTENFTFNAPQFVDFSSGLNEEDVQFADAYFGKKFKIKC